MMMITVTSGGTSRGRTSRIVGVGGRGFAGGGATAGETDAQAQAEANNEA